MSAPSMDLLRLATIGSVDDGKSTLIGRLLVDTRQLFDDQLDAIAHASQRRGLGDLDLSFVTDGLRAEREQGITIDVAYRYAASPTRKFIIADCPGHVQYTRNMATGASTADLALVVVDVAHGLKEQTRRHLVIAALLGVRSLIVAVNKMDAVNWSAAAYQSVCDEVDTIAGELEFSSHRCVPVSALYGDNVVERSDKSPWYEGPSVLGALQDADAGVWESTGPTRLPIQWVLRGDGGGRTYAGMLSGGALHVGDALQLLPAGLDTSVQSISSGSGVRDVAIAGLSIDVGLAHDTDAGRGDLLAATPLPTVTRDLFATICWFGAAPLEAGQRLRLKHTTRSTPVRVNALEGAIDVATLSVEAASELATNEIGLAHLSTAEPLAVDDYRDNRVTGSFVLIDEVSNATVAAGMIGRASFLSRYA